MNIGRYGEYIALQYLIKKNYIILEKNYRTKKCEIDIICFRENTIIFIEVKTRFSKLYKSLSDIINRNKLKKLKYCVSSYLNEIDMDYMAQIDCILIILDYRKKINEILHIESIDI